MILMNDFKAEPKKLRQAMLDAAERVLESGWYVLGGEVEQFERLWAQQCGVDYGVGVANGMDAIEIALRSIEIGPGDEVITTPMTAFATVLAIIRAGATPVLADIDPNTALLSLASAKRCLSKKTKAVLLVHLYGQMRDMAMWTDFCDKHSLLLVEDCAQAHLARWENRVAGSFGVVGAYSFYPTKNLGAPGDAGMLVTRNAGVAERSKRLRNYGQSIRYHHPDLGLNSRLDEMHAAMLAVRFEWLAEFTVKRQYVAKRYDQEIENPKIRKLTTPQEVGAHVYHLYAVCCQARTQLQRYLRDNQIQTLIHYPIPIHQQIPMREVSRDRLGLAESERHAEACLSLPCHPQMTEEDIDHVIRALNTFE